MLKSLHMILLLIKVGKAVEHRTYLYFSLILLTEFVSLCVSKISNGLLFELNHSKGHRGIQDAENAFGICLFEFAAGFYVRVGKPSKWTCCYSTLRFLHPILNQISCFLTPYCTLFEVFQLYFNAMFQYSLY